MTHPRQTKTARVRAMLEQPGGASLDAICTSTGWQPHSARAALSGLRKAGCLIERTPDPDKAGGSTYRITGMGKAAT